MAQWRCTVSGEHGASRGSAPEAFEHRYSIDAGSQGEAEAIAGERAALEQGITADQIRVECDRASLLAMRAATTAELAEPGHATHLERAAARDGATLEEVSTAKRANPHWPD